MHATIDQRSKPASPGIHVDLSIVPFTHTVLLVECWNTRICILYRMHAHRQPTHLARCREGLKTSLVQLEASVGKANPKLFRAIADMDENALQSKIDIF